MLAGASATVPLPNVVQVCGAYLERVKRPVPFTAAVAGKRRV